MLPDDVAEAKLINEFRARVADLSVDEGHLRRFLRARNHDLPKAEDMLRKSMAWRKDNCLEDAWTWEFPDELQHFDFYLDGKDKDGRSVFYFPAGRWEVRKMLQAGWKPELERKIYSTMSLIMRMFESKSCPEEFVIIIDLAEMTYWKITHYETVQIILKVFREYEQNFPERLKDAIVINAPWTLNCIFPLVKPLITGRTMQKVQIFDSNHEKYLPAILDIIPEDTLPSRFQENMDAFIQKQSG